MPALIILVPPSEFLTHGTQKRFRTLESSSPPMKTEYLYESFLPYFESLHMARWLTHLCDISRRLQKGGPISENIGDAAAHNARIFNPDLRPANTNLDEFVKLRKREEKVNSMSADERNEFYQSEWETIKDKITSEEIDLWDDTPHFTDKAEIKRFFVESLSYLRTKVCPAVNPQTSFLEALLGQIVENLEANSSSESQNKVRGYQALLTLWDCARMAQEGRPPYQIKFSPQVAEALGIDPIVEESRLATEYAVPDTFVRHALIAGKVARKHLPEYQQEIAALEEKLRQTKKNP